MIDLEFAVRYDEERAALEKARGPRPPPPPDDLRALRCEGCHKPIAKKRGPLSRCEACARERRLERGRVRKAQERRRAALLGRP